LLQQWLQLLLLQLLQLFNANRDVVDIGGKDPVTAFVPIVGTGFWQY
jgi:hypothetical protein